MKTETEEDLFVEDFNEELYTLVGYKIGRVWIAKPVGYKVGQPHAVTFDGDDAVKNIKKIVGWIHTHPNWPGYPSSTDNATMKAWCLSEGGPLLCAIHGGTDGITRAHWYFDEELPAKEGSIYRKGDYYMGVIPKDPRKAKKK